jgi:hypothetical protein
MDKFSLWLESVGEGDRLIIKDDGTFEIGDYNYHSQMPGYDNCEYVFHGYIFPGRKTLKISDFNVSYKQKKTDPKEAREFTKSVWRNIAPYISGAIENMVKNRVIGRNWTVQSFLNKQEFKVADILSVKPIGQQQAVDAEKQWVADREEEGQKLAAAVTKYLYKNKERNPKNWFYRYGESIKWEDSKENPLEEPPQDNAVAILSDGSRVEFYYGSGPMRITYNRTSPQDEVGQAIRDFLEVNPEEIVDCNGLNKFVDNYKEYKINLFKRFEPQAGDDIGDGEIYEPKEQPDLAKYMSRRVAGKYGQSYAVDGSTGYILPDGSIIKMGRGNNRDEDHRWIIPSRNAMKNWGWPELESETQKMHELIRRSGAIRVIVGNPFYITTAKPLTTQQRQAVKEALSRMKIKDVLISFLGGREYEFSTDEHDKMRRYLG